MSDLITLQFEKKTLEHFIEHLNRSFITRKIGSELFLLRFNIHYYDNKHAYLEESTMSLGEEHAGNAV